jgi:hypothetical protein
MKNKMFTAIKNMAGNKTLNKYSAKMKREKAFQNIATIRKIGILFEYNANAYAAAKKMMAFFISRKVEIFSLAFDSIKPDKKVQKKQAPPHIKLFSRTDLNWYNKPESEIVDKFIAQNFDVLIDMSHSTEYVYRYISTLSLAKCKIGGVEYKNDPFDWIFIEKSNDISKFVSLIINFLSTVKIQNNV